MGGGVGTTAVKSKLIARANLLVDPSKYWPILAWTSQLQLRFTAVANAHAASTDRQTPSLCIWLRWTDHNAPPFEFEIARASLILWWSCMRMIRWPYAWIYIYIYKGSFQYRSILYAGTSAPRLNFPMFGGVAIAREDGGFAGGRDD